MIGTPGVFDPASERVLFASNLPGWGRRGLVEMLREALGRSLTLDNDANLAALGELTFGSGAMVGTFVFLTVGTGLGMGIVIDRNLYRGVHGAGGEVGFLPFGVQGTLNVRQDSSASRLGMWRMLAEGIVRTAQFLGMRQPLTPRKIFDAARSGDKVALEVVEREGWYLALVVASVAADPGSRVGRTRWRNWTQC